MCGSVGSHLLGVGLLAEGLGELPLVLQQLVLLLLVLLLLLLQEELTRLQINDTTHYSLV